MLTEQKEMKYKKEQYKYAYDNMRDKITTFINNQNSNSNKFTPMIINLCQNIL